MSEDSKNICVFCPSPTEDNIHVFVDEYTLINVTTGLVTILSGGMHPVCKNHMFNILGSKGQPIVVPYGIPN